MNYFFDTSALVKIYHDEEGADEDTFVCWDIRLINLAREKNVKILSINGA